MIINYVLARNELEKRDKSRPHAELLTACRLLPVNYAMLEDIRCPWDPLVANGTEIKNTEVRKSLLDEQARKEMSEVMIGQTEASSGPAKRGFTSLRVIRDITMKLKRRK